MAPRILVVDDEAAIRFGLTEFLRSKGYDVDEADSCVRAEEIFFALKIKPPQGYGAVIGPEVGLRLPLPTTLIRGRWRSR